ncbi:hypothetical protein [Vibrio quintilis]|uniref:Phage late control gene D protein (GPD) n=1 Tax=Vibrio quintilis TaxID=1117707 RepID=A0A1M7YZ88_9VIBR|nr:hypothetical protein [Vibrio quintilis]SHO57904.1 hypothetical protein VQ7734_03674 [Vibrio quintilis]
MKLEKRLYISNQEYDIADVTVSLRLSLGGKAIFTVQADSAPELKEQVRLDIGYEQDMYIFFEGYIEKTQIAQNGFYKITVKEHAGALSLRWPLSIEHPTAIDILNQLTALTGLDFKYPDADYMKTRIPNFVHQGNGYQCLKNVAETFNIPDCIWCQCDDQKIWFGAYADSHFYNKPMSVPDEFSARQIADSITIVPYPMLRPGRVVNDHRINRVVLNNDEMTIYWQQNNSETYAHKQRIYNDFPELSAGFHLPKLGRVEFVRDNAASGNTADPFRPRYSVDIQMLDADMKVDKTVPVYRSVPLPVNMSGHESGLLAYPLEGTIVEIAFAYGRSDLPLIRSVYGRDYALPDIKPGEQLQQQRDEVSRRTDAAGNITDQTDQVFASSAFTMTDTAQQYSGSFGAHQLDISQHSFENITGKKLIEALGAVEVLTGDNMELGSLGNMHTATAGELIETIGKIRRSIAADHQWLQSPKTWVGSKQENILILLSELMQVVKELADTLSTHTHNGVLAGPATTSTPVQAQTITGHGEDSHSLKQRLDPITKR